ncbi:unnamed protein product, partial [Staurois parvus]
MNPRSEQFIALSSELWALAQGWTDNSWGPRAKEDLGAPVSLPTLKAHPKKPIKSTRGIAWGPLLTPCPRAVPECSNGQSAPALAN